MAGSGEPRLDEALAEKVLAEIEEDEVVSFLQELVRVPSVNPPGDVRDAIDVCARKLREGGFAVDFITNDPAIPNLVARYGQGDRSLLFNAHVDVVPTGEESAWNYRPFSATIADGKVYGRGAGDDKASVTAQVMAGIALARSGVPLRGQLIINEVGNEEVGGVDGAQLVARDPSIEPDWVIVGEQTLNRIAIGEKGGAGTRVTVYGKAAHGALPWEGVNAIEGMARVIAALREELWPKLEQRTHPYFHHSSASINLIEGGVKTNVVADRCSIMVDRRIIPGENPQECVAEIDEIVQRAVAGQPGLRAEVQALMPGGGREAILNEPENPVVQAMREANKYLGLSTDLTGFSMGTDGRHFVQQGYTTIIYGPGDPSLAHQPNEWVGIDEVLEATRAYALGALALLSQQ